MWGLCLALAAKGPALVLADSQALGDYQIKIYSLTQGEDVEGMRLFVLGASDDTLLSLGDEDFPYLFLDKDTGKDVDGDGFPDIVVVLAGEDKMKLVAYSLAEEGPQEIIFSLPPWAKMVSYEDVNDDGVPEILAADVRVEGFEDLEVPEVIAVLRKSGGGYWEEDPEAYTDYYNKRLEGLLAKIRMEQNPFKKKGYAVAYATYLFHMGKTEDAWREFLRLSDGDESLLMKFKQQLLFWEPGPEEEKE